MNLRLPSAFAIPFCVLVAAGSWAAAAGEGVGSTAVYPMLVVCVVILSAVLLRRVSITVPAAAAWALLAASHFFPFIPGIGGAYPPTRFAFIIACGLTAAAGRGNSSYSLKTWHYGVFAFWMLLLGIRSFEIDQRLGYGYDLAHVQNLLHNTMQGKLLFSDYLGSSILTHHAYFTLAILAPVYHLLPSAFTLQALQIAMLGGACLLVAHGARSRFGNEAAACTLLTFFLHPSFVGQALHEFDPGVIGTLGVSLAIFGYGRGNLGAMIFGAVIAAFSKEHFSVAVILGACVLFAKDRSRKELMMLFTIGVLGLAAFLACGFLLEGPVSLKTQFTLRFVELHESAIRPANVAGRIGYLFHMLVPYGGLPLVAFPVMIPMLPETAINVVSRFPMYYLAGHYSTLSLPFLSFASGAGIGFLRSKSKELSHAAVNYAIACAILGAVFSNIGPISHTGAFYDVIVTQSTNERRALHALINRMPAGSVAVMGRYRLLTLLADRKPTISLPYIDASKAINEKEIWILDEYDGAPPNERKLLDREGATLIYVR